jgi:hypothetical protein
MARNDVNYLVRIDAIYIVTLELYRYLPTYIVHRDHEQSERRNEGSTTNYEFFVSKILLAFSPIGLCASNHSRTCVAKPRDSSLERSCTRLR